MFARSAALPEQADVRRAAYLEFYPKEGKARGVQIDLDPKRLGLRYPVEVGLVGDSRRALQVLLPLLQRKTDRAFLEKAQAGGMSSGPERGSLSRGRPALD